MLILELKLGVASNLYRGNYILENNFSFMILADGPGRMSENTQPGPTSGLREGEQNAGLLLRSRCK